MSKKTKRNKVYGDSEAIKIFLYTVEEYFRFSNCFTNLNNKEDNPDYKYISLQTRLMLIRKYEDMKEAIYLRNVLDAIGNVYPEIVDSLNDISKEIDKIENSTLEIILSDGSKRDLHESIEDVIYGMYLHADQQKIESLVKTNIVTYLFAVEKYVTAWETILKTTYELIDNRVNDKYSREVFKRAPVVFVGKDVTQVQGIRSAPYWANLRGWDASPDEVKKLIGQISEEEGKILEIAERFITELQRDNYSTITLKKMIYPVTKAYWGNFVKAHEALENIEIGFSNKVRFNDAKDIAHVLLFKHFDSNGLVIINQPQYSEDIMALYLKKDSERTGWKVVSINDSPETIIRTITIDPNKAIQKVRKLFKG